MRIALTMAAAALSAALCGSAAADDDLEAQLSAQQATMLRMQNRFDQMQDQLDAQNGKIEELEHELSNLKAQLEKAQQAGAQNTAAQGGEGTAGQIQGAAEQPQPNAASQGNTAAASGPVTDAKGKALKSADDATKAEYQKAYKLVVDNKLKDSVPAFKAFVEKYPDCELTPNAWYWLGQVQFKQKQYPDARVSFLNAAGFKNSPKRADSLYKLGLIYKAQGDKDKARRFFEVVSRDYPGDTSAALAQKQLAAK